MRLRRRSTNILLLLLVMPAISCARPLESGSDAAVSAATVRVDNQAFLDVNVYALRGGQRIRLGTVSGISTRTFVIPRTLVGTGTAIRFLASFIGSNRAPVSEEMVILAGDHVEIMIPAA